MKFILSLALLASVSSVYSDTGLILIGDTGKDNEGQLNVSRAIGDLCSKERCDLGLLAGDNVYPEGVEHANDQILETMFDKYYNPLNLKFLVTLGNHDYGKYSNDWKRGSYQLEHAKKNPLFYFPHYYYTYETSDAVIAVIDSTRLMWKKEIAPQVELVKKAHQLAKEKKKWFFVMGHHPYLSNGKHGNAGNYERVPFPYFVSGKYVEEFLKEHICGKAQFYFAGHEHLLQVFDGDIKGCKTTLIVSGTGASSSKLYERNRSLFESKALGFFHIDVKSDSVRIRAVDQNSETLFDKNYIK